MEYKYSRYNVVVKDEDGFFLHNTKSGYMVQMDKMNYETFSELNKVTDNETLETFKNMGFIVYSDTDEVEELYFNNMRMKYDSTKLHVTVQTTNMCNFSCPYCYQDHIPATFDQNSQEIFIKFIDNSISRGINNIRIHWFGGEPTLNVDCILNIEKYLTKLQANNNGLEISNYITTNGYSLDANLYKNFTEYTNIKDIQITIDGPEEIHNLTRITHSKEGTYSRIINNIVTCLKIDSDITFTIRINLNTNNVNYISEYLTEMEKHGILTNDRVDFSFQQTHDFNHEKSDLYFKNKNDYAKSLIQVFKTIINKGLCIPRYSSMKYCNCLFDCINTFLISPDMKLYHCSATSGTNCVGKISEDGEMVLYSNYYSKINRNIFEKEKCKECKYLPICFGGCYNLETLGDDECIPEKYQYNELIRLYGYESTI